MKISVVGVCASGKTTLVRGLKALGYDAYVVAQEHSCVKTLWQKRQPDLLILLDANLQTIRQRRQVSWGEERLTVQKERLSHARQHADLFLPTDSLTARDVMNQTVAYIVGQYGSDYSR